MSFVAQPYEQFVSDLLTSLTGGTSREEHRFTGPDEAYSLTLLRALPDTLRVSGQTGDAFTVFELGIDFTFDEGTNAIRWKPGGRSPDDRSYFYVSYYTSDAQPRLTDRNPGSITTTAAEGISREFAVQHQQMLSIYNSGFVDLATDAALDHVVALVGVTRKNARFASGEVLFRRTTPAPGDIAIPAGMVVSTDLGQNFETTDKRTLRRGQLSVTCPIRAQVEGVPGKVDAGTIKSINRPVFGIESVVNEAATVFATQKETDDELRRRARGALERAGKSTVDAIRYALIEDLPEVTEANMQVVERPDTPGLVEVRLGVDRPPSPDFVQRLEESIFNSRPAGVHVVHNLPSGTPSDSVLQAEEITRQQALADLKALGEPDVNYLPADAFASMPQDVLLLRADVFLRLAQPNLSASQKQSVEDTARGTVTDYITNLPMGVPLIYSKLLGRIVAPDDVADAILLIGSEAGGTFYSFKGNLSMTGPQREGRKAKASAVFVGLMEENVFIDVLVTVEQSPAAAAGALPKITDAVQTAVQNAVNLKLAASRKGLSKKDLVGGVRDALKNSAPDFQFIADNPVVLNAEYEETGRVLNDTDQVDLADNESPVLRKLTVKLKGELDG